MKKTLRSTLLVFMLAMPLLQTHAIEVNRTELESTGQGNNIRFTNYTGPNAIINTMAQITAIGTALGETIAALPAQESGSAGIENRYRVTHMLAAQTPEKFDADIFTLGIDAGVDHIRNLRAILAGYLRTAYGYGEPDAQTLAVYITVYNAVYRGNMQLFQSRYKPQVTQLLTPQAAGLSINYEDWPGATQIVIPIGNIEGALSPIETSIISDKKVVDALKKEPDMAIETRTNMADLKERESQTAAEVAQSAAQSAAAAQQAATQAQQAAVVAQQAAVVAQQAATQAQQNAAMNPQDEKVQKEAQTAQETANTAQAKAVESQQQAVQTQQQANEAAQTAAVHQTVADKKLAEAQTERADITKDIKQVQKQESAASQIISIPALKLVNVKKMLSALVLINADTGKVVTESPVNVIRGRTLLTLNGGFAAIAGTNARNSAVRLVFIDGKTLEISAQSYEIAAEDAILVQGTDGMLYTIIENGRKYSLAKYNPQMILQARSEIFVQPETPITLTGTAVIVTDDQNEIQYLHGENLKILSF